MQSLCSGGKEWTKPLQTYREKRLNRHSAVREHSVRTQRSLRAPEGTVSGNHGGLFFSTQKMVRSAQDWPGQVKRFGDITHCCMQWAQNLRLREKGFTAAWDALPHTLKAVASNQTLHVGDLEVKGQKYKVKHFYCLKGIHLASPYLLRSFVGRLCQMLDEQFYSWSTKREGKKATEAYRKDFCRTTSVGKHCNKTWIRFTTGAELFLYWLF